MSALPQNDIQRLIALKKYNILDTAAEESFDDITSLAAQICETPIALITLLDKDQHWLTSTYGLNLLKTPREISFCQYAVVSDTLFEVPNALEDARFVDLPLVTGDPNIRFFAGMPLITDEGHALGTLCVIDQRPRSLTTLQRKGLAQLARQVILQMEHRLDAIKISEMAEMLQNTGGLARVGGWELNLKTNQIYWSSEVFQIHEIESDQAPTLAQTIHFFMPDGQQQIASATDLARMNLQPWDLELSLMTAKGNLRWIRTQGSAILENGVIHYLRGAIQDITQRKQSEIDLAWLNRALGMLCKCNENLIYIQNEQQLIVEICKNIVEVGGYQMAWVGYAEDNDETSISVQAKYGQYCALLEKQALQWSEKSLNALAPALQTIKNGKMFVENNLPTGPDYTGKQEALAQGFHAFICLPLKNDGQTFGVLTMYSSNARPFEADEIKLHQELADNLAAGINNIRAKKALEILNKAVLKLAQAVTAKSGKAFLTQLLTNVLDTVNAEAGYVAQLINQEDLTARTITVSVDSESVANFNFNLANEGASAFFKNHDYFIVAKHAERDHPTLSMMRFYQYQAFAGVCLRNIEGDDVGLILVFFKQPIESHAFNLIRAALKVFAARASSELERLRDDAIIREQASYLDKTHDAIVVRDMQDNIIFWNKGAEMLYGWTREEALYQKINVLLQHQPIDYAHAKAHVLENGMWEGETSEHDKAGNILIIDSHWTLFKDAQGQPKSIFAIKSNITHRKLIEAEIREYAFYDALTKLPNRRLLLDRLTQALSNTARSNQFGALFFIDLDNFKILNDTLGHDKGDILLKEVAKRLSQCVRNIDTVARLGGDEFVIMIEDLGFDARIAEAMATSISDKVIAQLNKPVLFDDYLHLSTPSIGVCLFNQVTESVDRLLQQADAAMYASKAAGRNRMTFHQAQIA